MFVLEMFIVLVNLVSVCKDARSCIASQPAFLRLFLHFLFFWFSETGVFGVMDRMGSQIAHFGVKALCLGLIYGRHFWCDRSWRCRILWFRGMGLCIDFFRVRSLLSIELFVGFEGVARWLGREGGG